MQEEGWMHTAIALQQPLDLTAPLRVQVLKHRRNVRASRWQSYLGETQARCSLLRTPVPMSVPPPGLALLSICPEGPGGKFCEESKSSGDNPTVFMSDKNLGV